MYNLKTKWTYYITCQKRSNNVLKNVRMMEIQFLFFISLSLKILAGVGIGFLGRVRIVPDPPRVVIPARMIHHTNDKSTAR
jgi:hypothetical protein